MTDATVLPRPRAVAQDAIPAPVAELAIRGGPRAVAAPYKERWRHIRWREAVRILRMMRADVSTIADGGSYISRFEADFARLTDSTYALTMNSGTATLHSAYFAVGVGPGSEVIVPSYTWFASAAPILQCGATPVFCDVDERTLTADPDDVERRITPRTRAICVVHIWGNPARLDRFVEIARRHGVALIEDCSHAPGATYDGRPVGSWGDIGCFSLQAQKAVSGGELGIATTSDPDLYDRMLVLGHNGRTGSGQKTGKYRVDNLSLGLKYRPHAYAVVLALGALGRLDELNDRRRRNYERLDEELAGCAAVRTIDAYPKSVRGGLIEFILRYDARHAGGWSRAAFVRALQSEGVPVDTERYASISTSAPLLHQTDLFNGALNEALGMANGQAHASPAQLPVTERLPETLLTMPPLTDVSDDFIRDCAAAIRKVADYAASGRFASAPSAP